MWNQSSHWAATWVLGLDLLRSPTLEAGRKGDRVGQKEDSKSFGISLYEVTSSTMDVLPRVVTSFKSSGGQALACRFRGYTFSPWQWVLVAFRSLWGIREWITRHAFEVRLCYWGEGACVCMCTCTSLACVPSVCWSLWLDFLKPHFIFTWPVSCVVIKTLTVLFVLMSPWLSMVKAEAVTVSVTYYHGPWHHQEFCFSPGDDETHL